MTFVNDLDDYDDDGFGIGKEEKKTNPKIFILNVLFG